VVRRKGRISRFEGRGDLGTFSEADSARIIERLGYSVSAG
jgi:hypothetical protein